MINFSKYLKWGCIVLLASVIASMGVRLVFSNDPYKEELDRYVSSDKQVTAMLGEVVEIDVTKLVVYEGTRTDAPYREYRCNLKGQKGKALLFVRIFTDAKASVDKYSIVSLERK